MNLALYMSVTDAAKAAGISTAWVRRLLARGELRGEKVGHSWLVLREDVSRFVRIGRGPVAQPPRLICHVDVTNCLGDITPKSPDCRAMTRSPARPAPRRPAKKARRPRKK